MAPLTDAQVSFILACTLAGWVFGWIAFANWLSATYNAHRLVAHVAGFVTGALSAFASALVAGALAMPLSEISVVFFCIGVLLLVPHCLALRSARTLAVRLARPAISVPPVAAQPAGLPSSPPVPETSAPARPKAVEHRAATFEPAPRAQILLPSVFRFGYCDHIGNHTIRTATISSISTNDRGDSYLEGFCQDRLENRTFRSDRVQGDLTDLTTGELIPVRVLLEAEQHSTVMAYIPAPVRPAARSKQKEWQNSVLFTGFTAKRRDQLEDIAQAAGWSVRATVGSTLDYLVIGPRAGASKVAKAEALGVAVVDEETFLSLAV